MASAAVPASSDRTLPPPAAPGSDMTGCPDCGGPIARAYCPDCGEPRFDPARLTTRRLVRQGMHELFDVDSKTVQTFLTLFRRPGVLTAEFLAGRTRRYLPPLRVYLTLFAVLLLTTSIYTDRTVETRRFVDKLQSSPDTSFQHIMARAARRHHESERAMMEQTQIKGQEYRTNPWLRIADPIIVGGLLALLFRARRRSYAEHLVFALHVLSANLAMSIILGYPQYRFLDDKPIVVSLKALQWVALGAYFFVAARAVYVEPRRRTAIKSVGFVFGSMIAVLVVPALAMVVAMVQVMIR